jgi:tetratricopeptide (TPR) repeat protein
LLGLAATGCNASVPWIAAPGEPVPATAPPPATKQVRTGGACLELGEAQQPALNREEFVQKVGKLLESQRVEVARRLVRRYPDISLEVLRHTTGVQGITDNVRFIAQVYDEQCGGQQGATAWQSLLQDRNANPGKYGAYDSVRQQYLDCLHSNKAQEAARMPLVQQAQGTLLEIDAYRLTGEAFLMAGNSGEAATALTAALQRAQTIQPYQAAQIALLLGEAYRRGGKTEQAAATWQQAVLLAGHLLTWPQPLHDPVFWERAAYLRPVQCGWPDTAIRPLTPGGSAVVQAGAAANKIDVAEASLWMHVGQWRLDRGEANAALIAFKRAESLAMDPTVQDQLQFWQAKALVELNQPVAAMTVLVRLTGNTKGPFASPALAMLGALRLKEGNSQMALTLLQRAVEQNPATDWPGRAEAVADLGLAYLLCGDEANGLRCLHEAQQQFAATHAMALLQQCLDNEARYLEQLGKREEAAGVRLRLRSVENR